ncbi:MAG: response regulator transcription factor [Bacteroidota bacterium]
MIADDHALFRRGLASMIAECSDIQLVSEAENGANLIDQLESDSEHPDVILMDLKMPEMDGIEATKYIRNYFPNIKVIVLSMYDDEKFIIHLIEQGAHGYLLKDAEPEEVQRAIRAAMRNGYYFNDHISKVMLKGLIKKNKVKPSFSKNVKLTGRQVEVLKMICKEMTNQQIAKRLCLSVRTVEGYRNSLLEKTNAKNTAGLVMFAVKNGYVE